MSDEIPEDEGTAAEPVKVKQVAIAAGMVSAALAAAVAFTVAGPIGVGVAAAGVAGTGYAAHRIRNPRKGTLLHSWLTRTRRTKTTTTKAGTLTWPFTGNQSRRALSRSGGTGSSKRSGTGRIGSRAIRSGSTGRKASGPTSGRAGSLLPKTTRSRAARSAGGVLPKHRATRPVAHRTAATRSASKPTGLRMPKTPSRTPAKASRSTLSPATRRSGTFGKGSGRSILPKTSSGRGSLTRRGLLSPGSKSSGSGGTSARRSSGKSQLPKLTNSRSRHRPHRPGVGTTPGRSSTTARRGIRGRNPWLSTRGGQTLGKRSPDTRRTRRARRLGGIGPTTRSGSRAGTRNGRSPFRRWSPDRNRDTAPNRTRLRPRPYVRRTPGQLLRTSLRVPKRQRGTFGSRRGWRPFVLPTQRQAKRARRTLRLRSGVWLRRGIVWVAKTPARRWDRLWDRLPKAPLPLTHYTERAGMKVPTGPKTATRPGNPTPDPVPTPSSNVIPINRKALRSMSGPVEQIVDAFQQLAQFHPGSAIEVEQVLQQQQEMFAQIGAAYNHWANQLRDGQPFEQAVSDSVREIGVAVAATGSIAQNAHQMLRVAHEADFKRIENPRPDEGMWDPGSNR